jgi:uncharacterized glyoxalase superfamily protein PhnB
VPSNRIGESKRAEAIERRRVAAAAAAPEIERVDRAAAWMYSRAPLEKADRAGGKDVPEENHPIAVLLTVPDVRAAVEHYTQVLGFELHQHWPESGGWRFASCTLDRQTVMFGTADLLAERCPETALREIAAESGPSARLGAGVTIYIQVPDVDAHHRLVLDAGARVLHEPSTEFYGIRVFHAKDANGYTLAFYSPSEKERCESCGDGLQDERTAETFCTRCADMNGNLRPFDVILEAVVESFYVPVLKMERERALRVAEEKLRRQPAWS